jgi:predicted nucleic-acid-binding protein
MKIVADTNVLLRAAVRDNHDQARSAAIALREAELVAVPVSALCEFVWVMRQAYKKPATEVAESIRSLLIAPT